jgi:hypothetical protein
MLKREIAMVAESDNRTVRKLTAAEGYLELELPKLALEELASIGAPGEYQIPVMWMTGEALKVDGQFDEAVAPLKLVAESVEGPISARAWESLSDCLEKSGRKIADEEPVVTRGELLQEASQPGRVSVQIPGFGTLKFAAQDGAITISVEPQKPQD